MSSFSMVLLEEGVEMEIPASMSEALGLLDEVVPTFSCLDYGYRLGVVTRAQLKSNWAFRVQLMDSPSQQLIDDPVGCIELAKVDDYTVNLKVPPRSEQDFPGIVKYDGDGRYYGSFIFQLLNNLYDRSLIELPGALPGCNRLWPAQNAGGGGIIATEVKGPSKPDKVLVIGSGPIIIGQAAEFDYAGTQACKALREEGVTTVLVNSNPATIMTDRDVADSVYIEPLTVEVLERIIARERPDGILPTLGGQTGLNLAVALANAGVLEKYAVRLLGTPLETIRKAEDREFFKDFLLSIGEPVPPNTTVSSFDEAMEYWKQVGLPLVIRPAYTLGGTGGGIANTVEEFQEIVQSGLALSPISQVLLERSLVGWKEIEYEVIRDSDDNCITVCNMENLDPMGAHTGDSIVVAPSQTLTDKEYQMLRSASLKIIRGLGIEGGCNIQMALRPHPEVFETIQSESEAWEPTSDYYIIEVNPRVSRSSALASKATGYPIARVSAKIAVGRRLDEIANAVTGKTGAAFEPALDYCVVKIPRWPFDKFPGGDRSITTQMKATGEVMAIERSFEAALQKATRSLELGSRNLMWEDPDWRNPETGEIDLERLPLHPSDRRLWALAAALRGKTTKEELRDRSLIDPWFISALERIVNMERELLSSDLTPDLLWRAKRLGFSDEQVGTLADALPERVRNLRQSWDIRPGLQDGGHLRRRI